MKDENDETVSRGKRFLKASIRGVKYTISLPERIIRSLTAVFSGLLKEATDFGLPPALKSTTIHRIFIGQLLRYFVENVGRVEGVYEDDAVMEDEYAIKKTIGNGIEALGVVAVGASPLWVLAFLSDALGGTKAYFDRIGEELEKEGFLDDKLQMKDRSDFIESIQQLSDSLATNIDTPPLSRKDLEENMASMRYHFAEIGMKTKLSLGQVTELWNDMIDTAVEQKRSLSEIAGAMTLYLMNRAKKTNRTLRATGKVTGDILQENTVVYYREALTDIKNQGYFNVVRQEFSPYLRSAKTMFSPDEIMLTERLFSQELVDFFGSMKEKRAKKKTEKRFRKILEKKKRKTEMRQEGSARFLKPRFGSPDKDEEENS